MAHLLVVSFDSLGAADEVIRRLRALEQEHLVDLEDACVLQRDEQGNIHLKQVVSRRQDGFLSKDFWRRLVAHLLPRNGARDSRGFHLSRRFVEQVGSRLRPGTSAILAVVEPTRLEALIEAFKGEGGHILQTDLPDDVQRRLEMTLVESELPPARELQRLAVEASLRVSTARRSSGDDEEARRRRWVEELLHTDLTPQLIAQVYQTCVDAARRGSTRALVYRFPSEILEDRGRAIIDGDPEWPETLRGQPRRFYEFWKRELEPRGYRLSARLLNYRNGLPGDVGFFLSWGHSSESAG